MDESKHLSTEIIADMRNELQADLRSIRTIREWAERIIRLCDSREDDIKDILDA